MNPMLRQIAKLQGWRGRRAAELSIQPMIARLQDQAGESQRRLGDLVTLWSALLPAELLERTVITSLRSGVMRVTVDSAATAFEIDRLLRSGLEADLRRGFRGTLTRVRTTVGTLDEPETSAVRGNKAKFAAAGGKASSSQRGTTGGKRRSRPFTRDQ